MEPELWVEQSHLNLGYLNPLLASAICPVVGIIAFQYCQAKRTALSHSQRVLLQCGHKGK